MSAPDTAIIIGVSIAAFALIAPAYDAGWVGGASLLRRMGGFFARAQRRGLTHAEAMEELRLMTALVRVRTTASAWAIRDPSEWWRAIQVSIESETLKLERKDRRRFSTWAGGLIRDDILTPEAMAAVRQFERAAASPMVAAGSLSDIDAALRLR